MTARPTYRSLRWSDLRALRIVLLLSVLPASAQDAPGTAEFRVNTSTELDQIRPRIAADAAGELVVIWTRRSTQRDPVFGDFILDTGLFGRRFDRDGRALGGELQVSTRPSYRIHSSGIARHDDGDFIVVWGENPDVRARLFDATGTPRGDDLDVSLTGQGGLHPSVAGDSSGNWMVVWKGRAPNAPIQGRRFDAAAEAWEEPFLVSDEGSEGHYPSIANDDEDRFLVVWRRFSSPDSILGRRLSNAGEKLGEEFQVNLSEAPFSSALRDTELGRLAVGFDPEGRFTVAWSNPTGSFGGPGVVRFFDDEARPLGDETPLDSSGWAPAHATSPSGELLILSTRLGESMYFERFSLPARATFPLTWLSSGASALAFRPAGGVAIAFEHRGEIYGRLLPPPAEGGVMQLVETSGHGFLQLAEHDTPVDVTVVRTGGFGQASVRPRVEDVTTTAGKDYVSEAVEELVFDDSETGKSFRIRILEDELREGNELLRVGLSDPVGAVLREPSTVEVTLFDDDSFQPGEGPLPRGAERSANGFRDGAQREPRVDVNGRGEILVVWQSEDQDGDGWGVYARLFGADGRPRGGEFRISSATSGDQASPAVASSPDGSFLVTWLEAPFDVRGRRVVPDAGGARLEPGLALASTRPFRTGVPFSNEVGIDEAGDFVIAWNTIRPSPGSYLPETPAFYAGRFAADGRPRGRLASEYSHASSSALWSSPGGEFLVVWNDFDGFLRGQRFDEDGSRVDGGGFPVLPDPDFSRRHFTIAGAADRPFLVVWQGRSSTPPSTDGFLTRTDADLYARRFDADGAPLSDTFRVNSFEPGNQSLPRAASSPAGESTLVWTSTDQLGPGRSDVFARRLRSDGRFLGSRFPVNPSPFPQFSPDVAVEDDGDFVVVWEAEVAPGDFDVFLQRFSGSSCLSSRGALCLGQGRFRAEVEWKDFTGGQGHGRAVPLTDDTGAFWFFSPDNLELVVKVLDGRELTGHFWVFYGSLSNTEFDLTITDTETGRTKTYSNPANRFASQGDVRALPAPLDGSPREPSARLRAAAGTGCAAGQEALCLNDERFRVEVAWEDFSGGTGSGRAVPITGDTGAFWFFTPGNLELAVKVLDGRQITGHYWVFYASLSNVGFTIRVTDTATGAEKTYVNPPGRFASAGDVRALPGD